MSDNKKWLYDALKGQGVNLGTFEQFSTAMDDENNRKWAYQQATQKGLNVGTEEQFHSAFAVASPEKQPEEQPKQPEASIPEVKPTVTEEEIKADAEPSQAPSRYMFDPTKPLSMQMPGREVSPMPEEYRSKAEPEDPLEKGFDDEPNGPTWEERQQTKTEKATRKQVSSMLPTVDKMLNDAIGESMRAYQNEQDEAYKGGFWSALKYELAHGGARHGDAGATMIRENQRQFKGGGNAELQGRIAALQAAKKSLTDAQRIINEADHNAQSGTFGKWLESSFAGGAVRGFGQKLFDVSTWDMGMSDLENAGAFMDALNAFDQGKPLTESQQMMLDAKAVELATNAYFGSYVGRGYKAGGVTAESIPFMLEMCINPASSIGEAATNKMARYAIQRFGKEAAKKAGHKVARAAGRAAADLAGAAAMTATTGSVRTAADAIDRMNGDIQFETDENTGRSAFSDHTPGETAGVAFAKAFGSTTIENYSEMVGEYFAPVLGALGKTAGKGLDRIGLGKVNSFIEGVASSDVARVVKDFEHNAKWNGVFGEYAEEVVGNLMNALTVHDQTLDAAPGTGVFNLDQNIDTFLGVALMGGFMSSVKTGAYFIGGDYKGPEHRTKKALDRANRTADAAFSGTDYWEDVRNGIDANPNAALHDVLTSDAFTPEQRKAAVEYTKALLEHEGAVKAKEKRMTDSEANPVARDLESSFDNGYQLATEQEMNDAKNMFQLQQERLKQTVGVEDIDEQTALRTDDLPYSEDEKKAVIDYLNAKATYKGMIQRVKDDIESRIDAANTQVDLNTNAATGRIHPAVTTDDRKVYITGGNVVLNQDGTIDHEKSEKDIIIRDAETGAKEFWSIGMLKSVDAPIDPVDEKNAAAETIRQQIAQTEADKIDGKLQFRPGDTYTLTTPEGQSFPVQITTNEQGIVDNGDGTVNVILNGATANGAPVVSQMQKEEIQRMSDATNMGRLAQYEQDRAAKEQQEAQDARPVYSLNDIVTLSAGEGAPVRGNITAEADADGKYEVYTEAPINGRRVNLFTREELDGMVRDINGEPVTVPAVEEIPAAPQEVAQEPEAPAQPVPTTAMERIPVDETGNPVFEQAPVNDSWDALMEMNEGSESDTIDMARMMVENTEEEIKKAQKQKVKGTNPIEIKRSRDEIKSTIAGLQKKADYWKQIAGYPEQRRRNMEQEALRQKRARLAEARRIQREQGSRYGKEDKVLGDALSFREYVMRSIANGRTKFKWGNDPNNPSIKGLGSHLGFNDNPSERNQRIWMLNKTEGLYPEAAAEELLQGYAEELGLDEVPGMDTMEAFSELLDVLLSYGNPRAMFDAAKELHYQNDPNFLMEKEAEMQATMAEDEAKSFSREVPETPEKARGIIANVVELAKTVKDRVERAIIAALTPRQKQDFADKGIDVTDNFVHSIENSAILHNQKEHGDPAIEEKRGQIAIEESDYALIPDILEDYDTVEKSPNKNKQGRDVIIFTKTYPDGTVYYLEEVRENRESLAFQTMYKKKSGSGSSDGLMQDAASPSTPVAPSDNSVSVSDNKGSENSGESNTPAENPTVAAIDAARQEVNTQPTEAQKEAGNYKKGHVTIDGHDISIENPKGSIRRGVDADGKAWESTMVSDYGYIRRTEGVDGDHIDIFLSDNPTEGNVFVVDQIDPKTGAFDEHKVMYGFPDVDAARAAYLANYEEGWAGLGDITEVSKDEFRKWIDSSHRKTKPFAEYKSVKHVDEGIRLDKPLRNMFEVHDFMKSIGYKGRLSNALTDGNGKKFMKYQVSGSISPNIVWGETTPMDIYRQFYMYGNVMGVEIPADVRKSFEEEAASAKQVRDQLYASDREEIKDILNEAGIPFVDVIDSERGSRIVYTNRKTEGGNYMDYTDYANPEQVRENLDSIRDASKRYNKPSNPAGPKQVSVESLVGALSSHGQATLSEHTEDKVKERADALAKELKAGDVLTNDTEWSQGHNGKATIRLIEKRSGGFLAEINNPNFGGTVEVSMDDLVNRVMNEGYSLAPEGETNNAAPAPAKQDAVTVEPATYTTKAGKKLNMFRVNPGRELTKEEKAAANKIAKENRGWPDRENGGFLMRDEQSANKLADIFRDEKSLSEARPVSLADMQQLGSVSIETSEVEVPKADQKEPVWKYELTSVESGRTYLSRSQVMPDGTEIYDGHFDVRADNPEDLKGILQNNGLYDTLSNFDKQNLERKIEHWQFRQRVQNEGINGLHINDKVMYKGKESTVYDFEEYGDNRPVLDTGHAPVLYEVANWEDVQKAEAPKVEAAEAETQPKQEPLVNPSGNKLVTDERYEELKRKMRMKLGGQMNMGIDPEILAIGTEMAVYHIEKGARKFIEYAKGMIADLGDTIRPYLKAFYNGARELPEMETLADQMDSYDDVRKFDVTNFDREAPNPVETAQTVAREHEVQKEAEEGATVLQKVRNTVAKDSPSEETQARRAFSRAVAADLLEAVATGKKPYKNILYLRKRAEECGMTVDKEGRSDILLQELVEDGLVTAARDIVESGRYGGHKSKSAYDAIVQLYELQPTITQRSSNRIKMQQYSTPLPMAFVADMFADRPGAAVLEPTAGNGMLVFAVQASRVHANELDKTRLDNLKGQGFGLVTSQDATEPIREGKPIYDAVIANPPFGSLEAKEYDGVSISGLDPQIALNALASMKDDGKAAIIIGGNLEYGANGALKGGKKAFFSYLYDHYNVKGVVDMAGDLYAKQGTTFPTMMILIDGRRSEADRAQSKVYTPVKSAALAKVNNFDELYDTVVGVLNSKSKTNGYEVIRTQELGLFDNLGHAGETPVERPSVERGKDDSDVKRGLDGTRGNRKAGRDEGTGVQRTEKQGAGVSSGLGDTSIPRPDENSRGNGTAADNGTPSEGRRESTDRTGSGGNSNGSTQRVADGGVSASGTARSGVDVTPPKKKAPQQKEERKLTDEKLHYVHHSSAFSLESVAPAAMVEAMDDALSKIEEEFGQNIDDFVTQQLGYDSVDELHHALAAEQVDSVAMALYQMSKRNAMIIGDQTGVGKGRQMAALIRWAVRAGKKPIFITQKAGLFTDIYRDLVDIGSGDLKPFIFNSDGAMEDAKGNKVHTPLGKDAMQKVFETGTLPDEYDFAVLTYSQVNTGDEKSANEQYNERKKNGGRAKKPKASEMKVNPKATFLRKIAEDNYLFLDESHTAAGNSKSGYFLQSLVKDARAVTFASATFAKRPDTMPLYALRTAMSKAQLGEGKSLIGIIKRGGVTLQEIMSRALSKAGQMVRRERDMSDVVTDWETVTDPETVARARENYDTTIEAFNDIINFQARFITPLIDEKSGALALIGGKAEHRKGTKKMGIENTPFASKTYNYTKQLMLALKADAIVERVVSEIEAGRHPVIALESTMESILKDYAPGEVITEPTFSASLLRGLESVLKYTVTDENGKETQAVYHPSELGPEGERAYYDLQNKIREATKGIFISPLDSIIEGLRKRGYKVGELTGRSLCTATDEKGRTVVQNRTDKDKLKLQRDFNSGELDVLILNKSASTGISLHASKTFPDQRQRSMIIAQPLSDINDYMQMIGRIDRTGQVSRGYYINLALPVPAEQRFNMMLSTKLKSLNANTTTSQDSESNSVDAPDLLNKYGSQVVVEYLRDNPDIYRKLGQPLKNASGQVTALGLDEYKPSEEDARKITGYVALLSTKEQQEFYDDVIRRYNELIAYLNETGTNDLRINVMPLEAKTLDRSVASEGTDPEGENPFAQHAYVEKVEMNVLSKPMSADEIRKAIQKINGGKDGAERIKEIIAQLREDSLARLKAEDERYERAKADAEEKIAKRAAIIMGHEKKTDEEKKEAIELFASTTREKVENDHESNTKKINGQANALYQRFRAFKVGTTYLIADNLETGGQSLFSSPAIFCGFKVKESKITPSTSLAVFAPLDGRRRIEVKMSNFTAVNQITDLTELNWNAAQQTNLDNWDSLVPNETRKEGFILTGNILQAIANTSDEMGNFTGTLVSYTDDEGNVRDGILMPDQWQPSLLPNAGVPINARLGEIMQGRKYTSTTGEVTIEPGEIMGGRPLFYRLSVPKTKAKGGKYFTDSVLLHAANGNDFHPGRGGKLVADIWPDSIKEVVDRLGAMGVRISDESKQQSGRRFRDGGFSADEVAPVSNVVAAAASLADRLGEKVRIIEDVNEITDPDSRTLRRMRRARGWYDPSTGEVVVVAPNALSVADVEATVFHEIVGHKGLREMVGEKNFNGFIGRIFVHAGKEVRGRIIEMSKKHGWDFSEATEEYIARLAETGFDERENRSFWEKVRDFFEDMLHEAKLHFGFHISDNDLRYALWRTYQMKHSRGPVAVAEDVTMRRKMEVGNYRRFREADEVLHDRVEARAHYEDAIKTGLYQFREAVQDSMLGLRTLMQSVLKSEGKGKVNIEDVDAFENAYLAENAMSSMNKAEQEAYYKLVMSPLLKAVADLGVPQQEVTEYMMAKHGIERNIAMAEREAKAAEEADTEKKKTYAEHLEDARKRDYAGLTALTGKRTVRDAEREAQRMVADFEADHDTADLWEKVNAATKASLQKLYESGLLTKDGFDHISDMYEYYIPLRGWDETTSDELYGYLSDHRSAMNSPLKRAEGRRSMADDPLAYIASMADTAIMQGNRNRMKQKFLNFALNHPSDLVNISDIWLSYDETTDTWKPVFADLQPTDTAEEVEQKVSAFNEKMKSLAESDPDHYKSGKDAKNIPFKVVHENLREHQVLVKRGGKTYVLTINGNPRAAQALNGLTNPDTDISGFVGSLIKGGQWVNRNLSAAYTTRNIEFVASNFLRDMLYSNCMTWVKENPRYALRFHKNFGRFNPGHMLSLFVKWENGTLYDADQTEKMFKQFMMNGGETGYTTVKDIDKQKKEIATQIKKYGKTMPVGKALDVLGMSFDVLNRAVENTARFAAFVTSREMGRTMERSIYDAKEVSVNFNKKGAGDKFAGAAGQTWLGQIGSYGSAGGRLLYVFWNAGVQGLTNFGRAAKRHPVKATAGMATMFTLGMAVAALAASGGDGDDDDKNAYYNLPEYVRRSNICFRAGNSWITIPLPIEFRGIYGMGELAMGTITGKEHYTDSELAFQIGSQVSQVLPLDMLEGGGGISPLIPSAAKPVVEAYIMNKSWTGMPIYKDTYFNKDLPNWTKAYKSANKQLVELAEAANAFSGGDEFTKGAVDINPARLEYMLNGYFGGYATLVNKLVKMGETATGQRDFEWRNMLVASRVVKSGDERTERRKLQNEYYDLKDEFERTRRRLRGYENRADEGVAGYAEKIDFLYNSPEYLRYEVFDEYGPDIDAIRKDMKEETDPEALKELENEMYAVMRELVDKAHEATKRKK